MTPQELKVLQALRHNPMASQQEIANQLGLSRESVAGHIMRLTRKGKIIGKGYIFPPPKSIVVIGGANVDLIGSSFHSFLPADSNPGSISQTAGGVARNIAENLARLGTQVQLVSVIGNDPRGRWLLDDLVRCQISTEHCMVKPGLSTGTYIALNDSSGFLQGAVADMSIMDKFGPDDLISRLPTLQAANQILVEANCSEELIQWLAEQQFSSPISADAVSETKAPRLAALLPKLSILKTNRAEALAILQQSSLSNDEILDALLEKGIKKVLLSLGAEGAILANSEQRIQAAPPKTDQMISDTGAGDALMAAVMYSELQEHTLQQQLQLALACATFTLKSTLAVNPDLSYEKIQLWMENSCTNI
ncbi:carbohydrate kinase [Gynuella sp.]|uniref:carbohydrate kinase n=1 Tax=Gynuella sp. TaxID=2969146 RepID=UPI003D0C6778